MFNTLLPEACAAGRCLNLVLLKSKFLQPGIRSKVRGRGWVLQISREKRGAPFKFSFERRNLAGRTVSLHNLRAHFQKLLRLHMQVLKVPRNTACLHLSARRFCVREVGRIKVLRWSCQRGRSYLHNAAFDASQRHQIIFIQPVVNIFACECVQYLLFCVMPMLFHSNT